MLLDPFTLDPGERIRGHGHAVLHVCLIHSGGFREHLPSSPRDCGAGTVRVSPAGTAHFLDVGDAGATGAMLELPAAVTASLAASVDATAYLHPDASAAPLQRLRMAGADPFALECAALEFVARSLHATVRPDPPRWLSDLRTELDDDPPGSPSLRACAGRHDRHASHAARAFRDWFGRSLGAHVRARRLAVAAARLHAPDGVPDLAALAADLGFADQAHFTRTFRARYGIPPGRFRRLAEPAIRTDPDVRAESLNAPRAIPVQDTGPARRHPGTHAHALGRSP